MAEEPYKVPLVERCRRADSMARELSEHLLQSLVPSLSRLRRSSKVYDETEVSDQEMFDHMQQVLESADFADKLQETLMQYLKSIDGESRAVLNL